MSTWTHAVRRGETTKDLLPISEVFHNTIQGEGPAAGRTASFVRLMGCNLSCSWCDSAYTWDASRYNLRAETKPRSAYDLAEELADHPGLVILTGGEPLLQQNTPGFRRLLDLLADHGKAVHVESNGTIPPNLHLLHNTELIVLSPKLAHAGPHRGHQSPAVHQAWREVADKVAVKYVCRDAADVRAAARLAADMGVPPRRTWVMPEGRSAAVLGERWPIIAEAAAHLGLCASHRLHVLAWGDERGR